MISFADNESMYGAKAILEQESNEHGPTVQEIEHRIADIKDAVLVCI